MGNATNIYFKFNGLLPSEQIEICHCSVIGFKQSNVMEKANLVSSPIIYDEIVTSYTTVSPRMSLNFTTDIA